MKVLSINSSVQLLNQFKKTDDNQKNCSQNGKINNSFSYPKGFVPYFGARLNRTPENFYEQEFNKKGMPQTLKNYLYSNYEVNKLKRPMQLSQEAFQDLMYCESVEDVKEMFPDEPLFQNLKTLETIRPKQGYLRDLRMVDTKNNEVLSSGEDLTVYLLKKVYLEGKDIDEINNDFEKDMKPELKVENATKDGAYFLHTTLRSLGVYLPDKSYWASLQATRLDKEYVPHVITVKTPHRKPVFTKPRVSKPLNLSPEERQRRREMMINRWIDMSPIQRQKQLEKMKEGQENSTFYKYMTAIILIANDRAKFTDKMYQFFRENREKTGVECPENLDDLTPKQTKLMRQFWEQNHRLKRSYSYYISDTLKEFEQAELQGDEAIGALLNKAAKIRDRNDERVARRKLADPENVKKYFLTLIGKQSEFLPQSFKDKYIKFLMKHKTFNETLVAVAAPLIARDEQDKKLWGKSQQIVKDLYDEFSAKNNKDVIAAEVSLAMTIKPYMDILADKCKNMGLDKKAQDISVDSIEMFSANTMGLVDIVYKYKLDDIVAERKHVIDSTMEAYTKGFSEEELRMQTKILLDYIGKVVQNGGYKLLSNEKVRKRSDKYLARVYKDLVNNKTARKVFAEFISDYEARLKAVNDLEAAYNKNDIVPQSVKSQLKYTKYYIYETIIDDLLAKIENN